MLESERNARQELSDCHRLMYKHGMSDLFVTHITLRVPGSDDVLVGPYGRLFNQMTPECLLKMNSRGEYYTAVPALHNPTAANLHVPIHFSHESTVSHNCVIHSHTPCGNAVACTADGLLPITQKAMLVIPFVRYHPYNALALESEEGDAMARCLGNGRIIVMRNHGLLATGENVTEAFLWMQWMEQACRYQQSLPTRSELIYPSAHAQDTTYTQARALLGEQGSMRFNNNVYWKALTSDLDGVPL